MIRWFWERMMVVFWWSAMSSKWNLANSAIADTLAEIVSKLTSAGIPVLVEMEAA